MQADLGFSYPHMPKDTFSHGVTQFRAASELSEALCE